MTTAIPETPNRVRADVLRLYMNHPFPQWDHRERARRLPAELCRYRFLGLEPFLKNARLLDVGCGTGNRTMLAAKHYGVSEFVGFDQSSASLAIAEGVAREEGFDRFRPVRGDLMRLPFEDGEFDVVVSWGVLHHTTQPMTGLREMVRVCKEGGFVAFFVYNPYAHWRHNLQKWRVRRASGDDVEVAFDVANKLYGTKPISGMSPEEIARFYDQYCHPYKTEHDLGEMLRWLEECGLSYWGSYPPLRFKDTLAWLQYRAQLASDAPARRAWQRALLSMAARLPEMSAASTRYGEPLAVNRFVWQAVYAWLGRSGEYSHGAAISGRKQSRA